MSAVMQTNFAAPAERYAGLSQEAKARLVRAEVQLISRFLRTDLVDVCWRCHACGTGRVHIRRTTTKEAGGRVELTATRGKCHTPGCLDWED
ncbi:MAG: hypothetical protein P4L92_22885 [Rudaea sp.]|nr:hypothetical protein [Rudaea sp.]